MYKDRINKAVEFLKNVGGYIEDMGRIYGDLTDDDCTDLLNILKGEIK